MLVLPALFLLCVASSAQSATLRYNPAAPAAPQSLQLNLDLPPGQRWTELGRKYKNDLKKIVKLFVADRIDAKVRGMAEIVANNLDRFIAEPYNLEMRSLANATEVKLADIILLNAVYEITAFCTSTVAVDMNNQVWHGRNFDYGDDDKEKMMLRNYTFVANYTKNGKTAYSGVALLGYVGLATGVRPHGFSITIDERNQGSRALNIFSALEEIIRYGRFNSVGFVLRSALADKQEYSGAVAYLSGAPLVAPCYFIIGGLSGDQGAILTRDRLRLADIYRLDQKSSRWFVLETNYDRWTTPPPDDDRRTPGIQHMTAMTRKNLNAENLFSVMSMSNTCNANTIYTIVTSAASPEVTRVAIQYCKDGNQRRRPANRFN